jgi:membrane associated rhomboid family serine protease
MIPLRDSMRSRTFPIVNLILIVICTIVFFKEIALGSQELNQFTLTYGLIPARTMSQLKAGAPVLSLAAPFVTAMFLHGSWVHIIGNMIYLWIFGDNVEDRVGHIPYLFFYLVVGAAGSLAHIIADPASPVPIIGASGAIAGILGAYFISYPRSRILTLLPLFFFITIVEVRAAWFLLFWFVIQLFSGFGASVSADSVGWWAHIGGFVAGAVLINLFPRVSRLSQ